AGALSMGAGEYVSVRSQRELLDASVPDLSTKDALPDLDVDVNELALVYRARGMSEEDAGAHAAAVLAGVHASDHSPATGSMSIAEQNEAVGTGLSAASSSFLFFASGAIIPVLPYLFGLQGMP